MSIRTWVAFAMIGGVAMAGCAGKTDEAPVEPEDTDEETDADADADADTDSDADADTTPEDTDTGEPAPAIPTVIATLTPSPAHPGDTVRIDVVIENFTMSDPTLSLPPEEGVGHYHVYLGEDILTAGYEAFVEFTVSPESPVGEYPIRVALQNSEHVEVDPQIDGEVTLIVE